MGLPDQPVAVAEPKAAAEGLARTDTGGPPIAGEVSARASFWTLQASHAVIDVYPVFIASLAVTLNDRLDMTPGQYAAMFAVGPIVSGLPQAFFAWATDRFDTRFCAWFGLALGAMCLCSIGFAETFWQLIALQVLGLTGTGMFHPIGAALAGQLAQKALHHGRSWGVSIFYSAGMVGGITGPIICTRMTEAWGMRSLAWLIVPSMLFAWVLMRATARAPHRHDGHHAAHRALSAEERRERWRAVWILFVANIMRFVVNTGVVVLFGYWARARIQDDVAKATNLTGNLVSSLSMGMMIFGLLGGRLIRPGHEKTPMFWLSLAGAIPVALIALAGDHLGMWAGYLMAAASALGFAGIIPCTISLAQRLLPGHTGLASGLMLGTSWSLA
jgi:MFS family permease